MTDNPESTTYNTEPVLRSEFLKFKDEILSLISQKETALYNKIDTYKEEMASTEKRYESKVNHIDEQYTNFINVSSSINHRLDKLNTYEATTQRINDQLVSHEIRITNISKDFTKAIQKYDKIFLDNLVLPGYIGEFCKYKNTKEFFDDTIKQIGLLNNFKEKNILDLKKYKERLETIIKNFNLQVDNNSKANMKYVNEIKDKTESNFKEKFEEIKETIHEMKLENSKYAIELKAKSMNLSKEWDKMMKIREEIYEKFDDKVNTMAKSNDNTVHSFNELQEEFSKIKKKFGELAEFIRDVRFRKNIGGDVNKREIKQLINKISFKGKNNYDDNKEFGNARHHSPKIESRIKKYIKGESAIPETTIMRRKRHSVTGKVLSSELNAMKNMYKHYTGDEDVVTNNKNKEEINSESSEGNENNNEVVLSTGIKDNNNNGRYESEIIPNEKVIHELSPELGQSAYKMDKFKSPEINVNVTENNNTKKNEDNNNVNNNNSNNSKVTPSNNTLVNEFNMTMNGNLKAMMDL